VAAIANTLDGDLLPPSQDISFSTLAGTGWDPRVYQDDETERGGQTVPAGRGAMQQVATTFLRALYGAGLKLKEWHPHTHRLSWYEPPVGLDAVVSPDRSWDLVFTNDTGHYLLIKTRVEPVKQQVFIYLYGPRLGWKVSVDNGKITKIYPHGPKIVRQDTSLPPGQLRQIQWAHDGADVVVQRTITYRNGKVVTDQLHTHYKPWQAIVLIGSAPPTPTPTPSPTPTKKSARSTPGPTATPTPAP
jgi:vancomycin resistance protein YoaR